MVLSSSGVVTTPGRSLVGVAGFRTFRQVLGAGAFEGVSSIGIGVRARLPFRVFTLAGPGSHSRLVIDVAHLWTASSPSGFGTAAVSGTGPTGQTVVASIRVGSHPGYDRVVFTSRSGIGRYEVGYVGQVLADASGRPVPLLGTAFLEVTFRGTPWTTSPAPEPTITPGFPALRQLKGAGEFEAVLHYGIVQATRAGFRVFTLTNPSRLVIDLADPAGRS